MNERGKNIITTAICTSVGVGLIYVVGKYRKSIWKSIESVWKFFDPLYGRDVRIVNSVDECRDVVNELKL